MSETDIDRARLRTIRARARLADALQALKARLMPRTIARNLVDATKDKAVDAAEAGVDAVKARPAVAIGAAALAALLLARRPLSRAFSSDTEETPSAKPRSFRERYPRKPVRKAKP